MPMPKPPDRTASRRPGPQPASWSRRGFLAAGLGSLAGLATVNCWREGDPQEHDVCVIGSGPAGCLIASRLAAAGADVLLVESGPPADVPRSPRWTELDAYRSTGAIPYDAAATRERGGGGTSTVWTGHCPRLHPSNLADPGWGGARWPVSYAELEPWYELAEAELFVQGGGASPASPPRRHPYPLPPDPRRDLAPLDEVLTGSGVEVEYLPLAVVGDGPIRFAKTHLPKLATEPRVTLLYRATVTHLELDGGGRARTAVARSFNGGPWRFRARRFVLAGGGLETVRLLLASGERAAAGSGRGDIALGGPTLGRGFMEHLVVAGTGELPQAALPDDPRYLGSSMTFQYLPAARAAGLGGVVAKLYLMPRPGAPPGTAGGKLDVHFELEMEPQPDNRLRLSDQQLDGLGEPGLEISLSPSPRDRATIRHARALLDELFAAVGARNVQTGPQVSWAHHHMGACRTAGDPAAGVVDGDLKVHGTDNLYAATTGVFVTGGASSPTLTLAALALRLSDHLTAELGLTG